MCSSSCPYNYMVKPKKTKTPKEKRFTRTKGKTLNH